jgi:CRISPR-associated protein Csm1
MLDLFFGGYVDYLMRGETGFRLLYTVYSGGDDLLVVGPWDTVARFAEKLVADFRRFTGENASITISAGLVLSHDHTPVAQAAEAADSALEEAKTLPPEEADGAPPKNQICAFGHRVNWEVYDDILEEAARVAKWLEAGAFSKSFVRTLHHCGRRYLDFTRTRDASHLVFIPMLAYAMARNIPQRPGEAPEVTEAREWAQNFQDLNDPLLPHLQLVAECSINLTRGGGK